MFRRTRLFRVEGANFKSHDPNAGKPKNPHRPSKPFMSDERPPPTISLEWLCYSTFFRWGFYALLAYGAVDLTRFLFYRLSPGTVPLQPSRSSSIVSSTVLLDVPCKRYVGCDVVATELALDGDTAHYMPKEASSALQHDLPHHKPRRSVADRTREFRDFVGLVADRIAGSLVVISVDSPTAKGNAVPPRSAGAEYAPDKQQQQQKTDPFAFDAPAAQWPTLDEQNSAASALKEKQERRLSENHEDVWGRRGVSKAVGDAARPNGLPGFLSWANSRFDRPSSPDWSLPKHIEDTSNNTLIDKDAPVELEEASKAPGKPDELPTRMGDSAQFKNRGSSSSAAAASPPVSAAASASPSDSTATATATPSSSSSSSSGTTVTHSDQSSIDDQLHRFMSVTFEPREGASRALLADHGVPPELLVKCSEASTRGSLSSRCTVDNSVLTALRHRSMLAAIAMLPDPLPTHLQVATLGAGPTPIAGFLWRFFAQHLKRLDVLTEPAIMEHSSVVDFGLARRHGPVAVSDMDEEKFMLQTDKKYDLMFVSAIGKGAPAGFSTPASARAISEEEKMLANPALSPEYVELVRKTLSQVGVAAFEMRAEDWLSQRIVRDVFGQSNCFQFTVPKSPGDVVVLAGYSLPLGAVKRRHVVHRAEDISFAFRLPYDLGAACPMEWLVW